ncbi:hypothetical protein SLE2022_137200 [Rubroshorea leprosula]
MEQQDEPALWISEPESMVSVTIGRVMSTLLAARPKKLQDSISRLCPDSNKASLRSLDESLWFLHKYVREAAQREETLDEILVPMIEHSLKSKDSKHGNQAMILFNWLFQDEVLFQIVATNLANIIARKDDRYIALGWCTLVRNLVEYESNMEQYLVNGIKEKYSALLKIFCSCISHLLGVIRKGSTLQDKFELPSRLAVSAADCFLALTEALTKKPDIPTSRPKLSDQQINLKLSCIGEKMVKSVPKSAEVLNMEMEYSLWNHLEDLIYLVERLLAWNKKSRPLHAKGVEKVLKWLQEIKAHYSGLKDEAGSKIQNSGALLLVSCWKHYGMLLHLEDHKFAKHYKELLDQYLSGIQYYTDNHSEGYAENKDGGIETRKFFFNCLCLLLGRFDGKKFETIVSDYGKQISQVLLSQLRCNEEAVIDGVVCIFKAVVFKPNFSSESGGLPDTKQVDVVIPLLLHLLDERDGAAKAVAALIAEYCSITADDNCLKEVLKRLASGNVFQRRNAADVISELIHISTDSICGLTPLTWQEIANQMLECLSDEETAVREQILNLLPLLDPSLVLPTLVRLVYSSDKKIEQSAANALVGVLKYNNQKPDVICMLIDSLSNLSQDIDDSKTRGHAREESSFNSDRVLKMIQDWSESVQDWKTLIGPLIDKMFAEPSNATIVRFLSHINEHLAENADEVLYRVLLQMKGQKEIDASSFSRWETRTCIGDDFLRMQQYLFERLCPLLIIRLLPLRVFNNLNSSVVYGRLLHPGVTQEYKDSNIIYDESIVALILNRAFSKVEFEDVRKLAAELCGRIHPHVLLPIICSQLGHATGSQDILKIKACLFSVCTSLVARGRDSLIHPVMLEIQGALEMILLWPSSDGDEVSKAQHGCIDCLALMICAEMQAPQSFSDCILKRDNIVSKSGDDASRNLVHRYVINKLIHDKGEVIPSSKSSREICEIGDTIFLSFRLCMANVLISACQKISDSGKKSFAQKVLPHLIRSVEVITCPEIRAACIQIMFSAVYHLKSAILPRSSDLLKISLKFLGNGSEKERMAGAKLMASLLASEDAILESISGELLEAQSILSNISSTDPSLDLRQVCNKLLACITPT